MGIKSFPVSGTINFFYFEDVNRASYPRPIVEDPEIKDKKDGVVAIEAWEGNLRRNQSKIQDIFQFQIRSEVRLRKPICPLEEALL